LYRRWGIKDGNNISVTIDENGKPQISVGETQVIKSLRAG